MAKKSPATFTAFRFFNEEQPGIESTHVGVRAPRLVSAADSAVVWERPNGKPGAWKKHLGELKLCASGLHGSDGVFAALQHAAGTVMAKVQVRGAIPKAKWDAGKFCARSMRVTHVYPEAALRGLACLPAAMSLHHFEKLRPSDSRPRSAILLGLKLAAGEDVSAAASAAAWDAARAAARAAAWDAARAAAWAAAWDAASAAARAAARAAAWAAAWDAASAAAWAAAWDAAWDAFIKDFNEAALGYLSLVETVGLRSAAFEIGRRLPALPKEQEAVTA